MKHYQSITKVPHGIIYLGVCGNTENEVIKITEKGFPQYSEFEVIECNCKSWNGKNNIPNDWVFPY